MRKLRKKRIAAAIIAGCLVLGSVTSEAGYQTESGVEGQIRIKDLTTEYAANPMGIDTDSVHFGWKMSSNRIGAKQSAYQIRVYKHGTEEPVWDSGRVEGSSSVGVAYEGKALEEATMYTWEVDVWNDAGEKF